jgi:hypothetical protein
MNSFIQAHVSKVLGILSGWDRLRFRGTVRMLANVAGLWRFLQCTGRALFKDFGRHAEELSQETRNRSLAVAEDLGRPVMHLQSPNVCKEDVAREIQKRDRVEEGLICVLTAVEPCWTFNIKGNRQTEKLELVHAYRKCQHLYHYMQHREFGFMHVRLQTWLPFNQFVMINGREWLARQMDRAGIRYLRRENCFAWVSDVEGAQALLGEQVRFNWSERLGELGARVNPAWESLRKDCRVGYYWSLDESEWASDIMFKDQGALTGLYGRLLRHGMEALGSRDVLRFLGRKVERGITPRLALEVTSDLKARPEGIRIKHRVGANFSEDVQQAGDGAAGGNDAQPGGPVAVAASEGGQGGLGKDAQGGGGYWAAGGGLAGVQRAVPGGHGGGGMSPDASGIDAGSFAGGGEGGTAGAGIEFTGNPGRTASGGCG